MADDTILIGRCRRDMVTGFTRNDHIVMAALAIVGHTEGNVIIVTGCKRTATRWGMTGRAIHGGNVKRHVIGMGCTAGRGAVTVGRWGMTFFTGLSSNRRVGMIDIKWRVKGISVMTGRAILGANSRMGHRIQWWQIGRHARCIDTVCRVIIMAGFTLQHGRIDDAVREHAAHAEAVNAMTGTAILDVGIHTGHDRVTDGLVCRIYSATAGIMAGIATLTRDCGISMVRIGWRKSRGGMTGTAITGGVVVND